MGAGRCSAEIGCSDERRDETNRRGLPRPRWAQRPAVRRVRGVKLPVHLVPRAANTPAARDGPMYVHER